MSDKKELENFADIICEAIIEEAKNTVIKIETLKLFYVKEEQKEFIHSQAITKLKQNLIHMVDEYMRDKAKEKAENKPE